MSGGWIVMTVSLVTVKVRAIVHNCSRQQIFECYESKSSNNFLCRSHETHNVSAEDGWIVTCVSFASASNT